jgi:hypothetical protein
MSTRDKDLQEAATFGLSGEQRKRLVVQESG